MMPSETMEKSPLSSFYMLSAPSSFLSSETRLPTERQVGFWNSQSVPDCHGTRGMPFAPGSKYTPSPMEDIQTINSHSLSSLEMPYFTKDSKNKFGVDHHSAITERLAMLSVAPSKTTEHDQVPQPNLHLHPASLYMDASNNHFQYENGLFSCSFSEVFNRKLSLSPNASLWQSSNTISTQSANATNAKLGKYEPFETSEEIEAHMIGDLLPGDDELLSGIIDDVEFTPCPNNGDDIEDDLFYSGGGMELEADDNVNHNKNSDLANGVTNNQQGILSIPFAGEHPYGEHPSRALFVRNINSNVEDSELRTLFEQYGDIRNMYTACKHRGFVIISYYDIRSARNAMRALQNKPLRRRKLDVHFSIPKDNPSEKDINQGTLVVFNLDSSVSNDDIHQIFGVYGEIKEIRETPHKHNHKFIEFYDVRAADAALRALDRSDIAGKRIKLEPSRPGGARRCSSIQQLSPDLEREANGCPQQGCPLKNSSSGGYGSGAIGSSGLDNESFQAILSTGQSPIYPFAPETSSNVIVSHNMTSPIRVASVGSNSSQPGLVELSHSLGQMNFGLQSISPLHSRSLTEYHDCLANNNPFSSVSTIPSMAININSRTTEVANKHGQRMDTSAFKTSGNMSCPLHGHQYAWGNSNSHHHHSPGHVMWPSSPSLMNNIPATSQLHNLPRAPSHLLNTVPLHLHHAGSAPSLNPSLWDRKNAYAREPPDTSIFRPGSLGNMGFPGSPTPNAFGITPAHNMYPYMSVNCVDPSVSSQIGLPSLQQRGHVFHGRHSIIPVPSTLDPHNDRVRNRRIDANSNQSDNKKQYELDVERIIRGDDLRTTLMIKNIPNKYTSKMLLAAIDENHRGTYDFIYLPIDFKNKCNVGYAFINMTDPQQIIPFFKTFNGKKWEKFNSEKVASLAYARIQGKAALIAHFQNSSLMNEDKRCRPILFHTDGPNAGDQEPFPMGINVRSRPGRPRTMNEVSHQESTTTSADDEDSPNGMSILSGSPGDLE